MTHLENLRQIFTQYKVLGEKALAQVEDKRLFWTFHNDSNSLAIIVQHMSGNMVSRFTRFFEEDGEKPWRQRDREFEAVLTSRNEVMEAWELGWDVFLEVLNGLNESDLERTVYIRGEAHTVIEALNRQLAHYAYHIGQMVYLAKMLAHNGWQSLSIPRHMSEEFNRQKLSPPPDEGKAD